MMHPVDSVQGLPTGVGRFFGRVGLGARRIKEAATEPEESSASEKAGEVASRGVQTTRDVFSYEQERGELAQRLHVDPYTTNPILSRQLDEVALVAFRTHLGVTTTAAMAVKLAVRKCRAASGLVWYLDFRPMVASHERRI